ncbi:MAG: hypothetical protein KAG97_04830 [Victivallales bacterium]|nr:hypothetical protein [Victivallales bacterium]
MLFPHSSYEHSKAVTPACFNLSANSITDSCERPHFTHPDNNIPASPVNLITPLNNQSLSANPTPSFTAAAASISFRKALSNLPAASALSKSILKSTLQILAIPEHLLILIP